MQFIWYFSVADGGDAGGAVQHGVRCGARRVLGAGQRDAVPVVRPGLPVRRHLPGRHDGARPRG